MRGLFSPWGAPAPISGWGLGMLADEETKAVAYRAMLEARIAYRQAQLLALAGNETRAEAVRDAWQPIIDARLEEVMLVGVPGGVEVKYAGFAY